MEQGESKVALATRLLALIAALLLGGVLVYCAIRVVGEEHKQSCIADAVARFPPPEGRGSNSLFGSDQPAARRQALDRCKATIF